MSRILSVVADTRRNTAVKQESASASLLKLIEDGNRSSEAAIADWAAFAVQMDPDMNGKTQVERRLLNKYQRRTNEAWVALYGNRTMADVEAGRDGGSSTANYSAHSNLAYWEAKWESVKYQAIRTDETVGEHADRVRAEEGLQLLDEDTTPEQAIVRGRLEEARLNWAMCLAEYESSKNVYEILASVPYVYTPYTEKPRAATGSKTAQLGARLMRK